MAAFLRFDVVRIVFANVGWVAQDADQARLMPVTVWLAARKRYPFLLQGGCEVIQGHSRQDLSIEPSDHRGGFGVNVECRLLGIPPDVPVDGLATGNQLAFAGSLAPCRLRLLANIGSRLLVGDAFDGAEEQAIGVVFVLFVGVGEHHGDPIDFLRFLEQEVL